MELPLQVEDFQIDELDLHILQFSLRDAQHVFFFHSCHIPKKIFFVKA